MLKLCWSALDAGCEVPSGTVVLSARLSRLTQYPPRWTQALVMIWIDDPEQVPKDKTRYIVGLLIDVDPAFSSLEGKLKGLG